MLTLSVASFGLGILYSTLFVKIVKPEKTAHDIIELELHSCDFEEDTITFATDWKGIEITPGQTKIILEDDGAVRRNENTR